MLKKLFCIVLTLCLLCGAALADAPLAGGWSARKTEAPLPLPEEAAAAFEKAVDGLTGAAFTPVALLAEQVVAGMNYCVLCWVEPVVPDPVGYYSLAYIYADLSGAAQLVGFVDLEYGQPEPEEDAPETAGTPILGGWTVWENDPAVLPEEAEKALNTALEGLVGAEYAPIALLAEQVVAGMNYCVLCTVTPVVPNAVPSCALVQVYADLAGGAEITSVVPLTFDLAAVSG